MCIRDRQYGDQFVTPEPVLPSQGKEFPCLGHDDPLLGFADHGDTTTTPELKDSLVAEEPESTKHSVRVYPQYHRHVPGGWEALPRTHVSVRNVLANLGGYLVMQRCGVAEQLDILHGNMQSITIVATTEADARTQPLPKDPEQLVVREARRRQRRRQFGVGITTLAVAASLALWLTIESGGQPPDARVIGAGTPSVPVPTIISSVIAHTIAARTAAFRFTVRTSLIFTHGSGSVNFVSPAYSRELRFPCLLN